MSRQPREGELQKFVDRLIARSPGVQSEVRRIERIKAAHKKRGERRKIRGGRAHFGPRNSQTRLHTDRVQQERRKKAIAEYGRCKTCKVRAISHGESPPSMRAAAEDQCLVCYYGDGRREKKWGDAGGESRALTLIERHGLCPKCGEHPIASGESEPSIAARENDLCIYCYRASRPKRTFLEKQICKRCGERPVSEGKSQECIFARRTEHCLRCYKEHAEEIR